MELHDTTNEQNQEEELSYLYFSRSPGSRWAVAIEQASAERFNVSVQHQQEGWGLFGVVRYWVDADRASAEARYLGLQRSLAELPEEIELATMRDRLPPEERHWGQADASET